MLRKELDTPNAELIADYISKNGEYEMTVAELAAKLAGLPPMMLVFTNADGVSMFINDVVVEAYAQDSPPICRLLCSETYQPPQAPQLTYDQQLAQQKQRAMQLSKNIDDASRMPEMGDA